MKIENDIADKVQEAMNKNQRDYYLREQLKERYDGDPKVKTLIDTAMGVEGMPRNT